jgi:hypothetical protein
LTHDTAGAAAASWLLAGGADLLVVKERLGHGSITTTEQYLHTLPGAQDAALAALDAMRGVARAASGSEPSGPEPVAGADAAAELAALRQMLTEIKGLYGGSGEGRTAG